MHCLLTLQPSHPSHPSVIRRMNRAYTLPGVFERGDITPPMREVRRWFNEDVFPTGGTP